MTPAQLKKNSEVALQPYLGALDRDMTAVSGDVSYTGIGFRPTMLIILGCVWSKPQWTGMFWAYRNSAFVKSGIVHTIGPATLPNGEMYDDGALDFVDHAQQWPVRQAADIKSFDEDGFTLTWTKYGTPNAGSAKVRYIAFP